MNRINAKKLLLSKWTAVKPVNKERHFIVTQLLFDDMNEDVIVACEFEAVISKHSYTMDWHDLKDDSCWLMGWK